jgi:hypothetical protein
MEANQEQSRHVDLRGRVIDVIRAEQPEVEKYATDNFLMYGLCDTMDHSRPELRRKIFDLYAQHIESEGKKLYHKPDLLTRPSIAELKIADPHDLFREAMADGDYEAAHQVALYFWLDDSLRDEAIQKHAEKCAEDLDSMDNPRLHGLAANLFSRGPGLNSEAGRKIAKMILDDTRPSYMNPFFTMGVLREEIAQSAGIEYLSPEERRKSFLDMWIDDFVGVGKYEGACSSFLRNQSMLACAGSLADKSRFLSAAMRDYTKALSAYKKYPVLRRGREGAERERQLKRFRKGLREYTELVRADAEVILTKSEDLIGRKELLELVEKEHRRITAKGE